MSLSLSQIRINGIRLGSRMNQVFQTFANGEMPPVTPLYKIMAQDRTNIVCLGLRTDPDGTSIFCCHDINFDFQSDIKKKIPKPAGKNPSCPIVSDVCTVSVYPHNASLNTLGFLIELFGESGISFQQMVSSHAMISFVIDRSDQKKILTFLEKKFDLPPTHTPYQQDFNHETVEFVKKRYPETRASYVEEKIKTYGIKLDRGLEMSEISFNPNHLKSCSNGLGKLARSGKKFYFTAAMTRGRDMALYCLTDPLAPQDKQDFFSHQASQGTVVPPVSVDLISFHGPHFGDRFGIFNTAMGCLNEASINVLLAGCTGASIYMVLPESMGKTAVSALAKGFESP